MEFFVAFEDSTETVVIASFGCAQDPAVWPYQGTVSNIDERWTSYASSFPKETFDLVGA
ncbi:hypothetical protein [Caballeronia zhejiangensis]|uniref:hypothetical protein n=1 Tax=Caballeronia zhejiangensis TaxID=871203 RepID=UPI001FD418B9|nr:hypothetical protein [Caballeronia zhejiangensis]